MFIEFYGSLTKQQEQQQQKHPKMQAKLLLPQRNMNNHLYFLMDNF